MRNSSKVGCFSSAGVVAGALAGALALVTGVATAAPGFTNGSLQGTYVFVGRGLSNGGQPNGPLVPTSRFGKAVFGGDGTCSISQGLYNLNSGLNGGVIASLQSAAQGCTYSVNADGSGTVNLTFLSNIPALSLSIFVVDNGNEVLFSSQTNGEMTNGESFFRKQGVQNFSNASLRGGWIWEGKGFGTFIPTEATGRFLFDGAGHCTFNGVNNTNGAFIFPVESEPDGCTYSVNSDGIGTISVALEAYPGAPGATFALSVMFSTESELQCETPTPATITSNKCWFRKQVNQNPQ